MTEHRTKITTVLARLEQQFPWQQRISLILTILKPLMEIQPVQNGGHQNVFYFYSFVIVTNAKIDK